MPNRPPVPVLPVRYTRDARSTSGAQRGISPSLWGPSVVVDFKTPLNRTRSTEWLLSFCLMGWGWAMVDPMTRFFDMPVYAVMKGVATETQWGSAALAIAVFRLVALYLNGWWRRTPVIRCAGAVAGGMMWLGIGLCMYLGAQISGQRMTAGLVFYLPFFVFEGWCVISTGYDMAQEGLFGTRPPKRYVARRS